jgi:hypothetical protein
MRTDGPEVTLPGKFPTIKLSRRVNELLATPIDPDLEVVALFALLGLALSLAAVRVDALTVDTLALLMTS